MMKTNRSSCFLAFIHENSVIQMYRLLPSHVTLYIVSFAHTSLVHIESYLTKSRTTVKRRPKLVSTSEMTI